MKGDMRELEQPDRPQRNNSPQLSDVSSPPFIPSFPDIYFLAESHPILIARL
jgi:hypothetical protein